MSTNSEDPEQGDQKDTFTLNVISPSTDVASPLNFPQLPTCTTVKQLKGKIREVVETRPDDGSQRLILRGHMLSRDEDTMLDIFGQEALVSQEPQTLHLVLRPPPSLPGPGDAEHDTTNVSQPARPFPGFARIPFIPPPPIIGPLNLGLPNPPQPNLNHQHQAQPSTHQLPLPQLGQVRAHPLQQIEQALDTLAARIQNLQRESQQVEQHMMQLQQRRQALSTPASNDQPAPGTPNLPALGVPNLPGQPMPQIGAFPLPANVMPQMLALPQRNIIVHQPQGAIALHGPTSVQNPQVPNGAMAFNPSMHHPTQTRTFVQDGVGPNGQRWHVSINETTITIPNSQAFQQHIPNVNSNPNPNPAPDIQAILRGLDRSRLGPANSTQRSSSTPAITRQRNPVGQLPATQPSTPRSTTHPTLTGPNPSFNMAPNPNSSIPNTIPIPAVRGVMPAMPPTEPMVYILSSPSGPRALLIGPTGTYYSPQAAAPPQPNMLRRSPRETNQPHSPRTPRRVQNPYQRREVAAPVANPLEAAAHPVNPVAGGAAAQIWPMLWLIVRLSLFVWFFTSGHNSWYRTLIVTGMAIIIFIINTGVFNGAGEQMLGPLRRHLETLLPLAAPPPDIPQEGNGSGPATNQQTATLQGREPAAVAQNLMELRRRQGVGWLITRLRRAEHYILLFLASLVPGLGERHIAARERGAAAAIEAQREREAAAVETARSEQDQAEANPQHGGEPAGEDGNGNNNLNEQGNGAEPPLIEI